MTSMTVVGIFFILGSIAVTVFGLWVWYTDTHPKKK
jgi:hypothetical protein